MPTITYYFNDYDTGEAWFGDSDRATNGNPDSDTHTNAALDVHGCIGNTCPGTNLGAISKVEIRAKLRRWGAVSTVDLQPLFNGGYGDPHNIPVSETAGWSGWEDVTNDQNAPSTWTWGEVHDMQAHVKSHIAVTNVGDWQYLYQVEIQVTYDDPLPPAFKPSDLSGLKLWLRADVDTFKDVAGTLPAEAQGDVVKLWKDSSGHDNHFSNASSGITLDLAKYNSTVPALKSPKSLPGGVLFGLAPVSGGIARTYIFLVAYPTATTSQAIADMGWQSGSASGQDYFFTCWYHIYVEDGRREWSGTAPLNVFHSEIYTQPGNNTNTLTLHVDGTLIGVYATNARTINTAATNNTATLFARNQSTGPSLSSAASLIEVLAYEGDLSDTDRGKLVDYLNDRELVLASVDLLADDLILPATVLDTPSFDHHQVEDPLLADDLVLPEPILDQPVLGDDAPSTSLLADDLILPVPVLDSPALGTWQVVTDLLADDLILPSPILSTPTLTAWQIPDDLLADDLILPEPVLSSPGLATYALPDHLLADDLILPQPVLDTPSLATWQAVDPLLADDLLLPVPVLSSPDLTTCIPSDHLLADDLVIGFILLGSPILDDGTCQPFGALQPATDTLDDCLSAYDDTTDACLQPATDTLDNSLTPYQDEPLS